MIFMLHKNFNLYNLTILNMSSMEILILTCWNMYIPKIGSHAVSENQNLFSQVEKFYNLFYSDDVC